ncbi:long-chain-fatty-acid--CoA ligase [Cupriavidus sp. AU9028]|uniref:long-chain-fatty-acid--CoA ligase n=1 Tax=Cupriavidus sp. AU9028 TaxID=2871157 RepID=UPI001C973E8F|nr:long-chain-fatty-acid--CoA ligase [Cupriavidus sp. AU9028]MBY4895899.1 long-chain-fatty-acid--CoA ligase [Cupriavidus sp. AU9028]
MEARTYPEFSTHYPLLLTTIMRRPVRMYPERTGIVYRNHVSGEYFRFTWREWYGRVCQLARALTGELDVAAGSPGEPGDRIATMALNTHRHLELYFGVPGVGATLHPVNVRLSPEHIVYTIRHAQDRVIFFDDVLLPLVEGIYDHIKDVVQQFVYMSDKPGLPDTRIAGLIHYEDLLARQPAGFDWPALHEDTNATLCYTTGTTGQPKGATFTHRQLYLMTIHMMAQQAIANTPSIDIADGLGVRLGEGAVPLLNTPLFHIHAWGAPFVAVYSAHKIVLHGTFTVQGFCELVERERVTSVGIVATIAAMLLEYPDLHKYDLSSLVRVNVGGGALPLGLKKKLEALIPSFRMSSGYGMTETAPTIVSSFIKQDLVDLDREQTDALLVKAGLPILGVDVEVVDGDGNPVPHDDQTVGEIVVRAPWTTERYFRDAEKSAELWRGGWLHTGDLGKVDEHGYITIADRIKDVIRSGAEMVPTVLLENLIAMADFVQEATVVGVPDPVWGERPMALVSVRTGFQADEVDVIEFLKVHGVQAGRITKWMLPTRVAITRDIPKTSVGKYNKKRIRDELERFLAIAKDVSARAS